MGRNAKRRRSALLQLLKFGGCRLDLLLDPPDIVGIVHLLLGAGQLLPQFLEFRLQHIDAF